jgi:hypothetical protein
MTSGQNRRDGGQTISSSRTQSRRSGQGDRSTSREPGSSSANFYSTESIQQLPSLPWDRREQTEIVTHFDHFSTRFFRGAPGHPEQERSRPAGILLSYIPTRFQGQHLPSAMERLSVLVADMPQLTRGTVQLFQQTARIAADNGDRQTWLTATVRAIEYGTAAYVLDCIQGRSPRSLASRARAIQRDLQAAITVLEATNSQRRLAICYICDLAIKVTQGNYNQVPDQLRQCIELLGSAFGMQDLAKQLTSGIMDEETWAPEIAATSARQLTSFSSTTT